LWITPPGDLHRMVTPIVNELPRRLEPMVADDFAVGLGPLPATPAPVALRAPSPRSGRRRVRHPRDERLGAAHPR
jgi:hypothetical protein